MTHPTGRNVCAMSLACEGKPADQRKRKQILTPTQRSYYAMKTRVTNKNRNSADRYIGRGIDMDPRWNEYSNFLSDMGDRPDNTTLDRINNDIGYWPGNCRWADAVQQARNTSRNVFVIIEGKSTILTDALKYANISQATYWKYKKLPENDCPQKAFDAAVNGKNSIRFSSDTHCANGHEWTDKNLRYYSGLRQCLTCHNELQRERRKRRAEDQEIERMFSDDVDPAAREPAPVVLRVVGGGLC